MSSAQELIDEATEIASQIQQPQMIKQLKSRVERAIIILNKLNPIFDAFTANLDIVSGSIGKNTALVSTLKESLRNLIEKTKDNATIMDIITKFMTQFNKIFNSGDSPIKTMIQSKEKLDNLIISLEQEIEGKENTDIIDTIRNSLKQLTDAYANSGILMDARGVDMTELEANLAKRGMANLDARSDMKAQEDAPDDLPGNVSILGGKRRKSKRKTKKGGRKRKSKKRKSRRKRKSKRKSKKKSKRTKKR